MPNTIEATITQKTGVVYVERMGERLSLEVGDSIYEQDLILTGPNTVAEIQYRDGTMSRLAPDTQMKLIDFEYGITADSENSFLVDMHHGAMRTVTGDIVKLNPNGFVLTADDVVVNVLGSDVLLAVEDGQSYVGTAYTSVGVEVAVENAEPYMLGSLQSLTFSPSSGVPVLQLYGSTIEMQNVFKEISFPLGWAIGTSATEEQLYMEQAPIAVDTITIGDSSNSVDNQVQIFPLGAHSAQQNILLMQTGLSEQALISPSFNLSGIQILPSNPNNLNGQSFTLSHIYPGTNSPSFLPDINEGPDTFYTTFDEADSPLNMTEGADWVQIDHMLGGIVNLLGGNDLIEVSAMGQDAESIKPAVFSRSSLTPADFEEGFLLKPAIFGGDGNDTISIGEMTQGSIYAGDGNDVVSITNLKRIEGSDKTPSIDLGDGHDVLSIYNIDSSLDGYLSAGDLFIGGDGTDILITKQNLPINPPDFEVQIVYAGANSADDLKLENFNVLLNEDGSITLGKEWIDKGGYYEHVNGAFMNVESSVEVVASPMTMSMSESSFAMPVAQEADPVQDAYNATMSQNATL